VRLELVLADALPPVVADRVQVEQVVLNLVGNAIDAVADVPPRDRFITVSTLTTDDGGIEVAVCDNGAGLPPRPAPGSSSRSSRRVRADGHGAGHLPVHRHRPRGAHLGRPQSGTRNHVPVHVARPPPPGASRGRAAAGLRTRRIGLEPGAAARRRVGRGAGCRGVRRAWSFVTTENPNTRRAARTYDDRRSEGASVVVTRATARPTVFVVDDDAELRGSLQ